MAKLNPKFGLEKGCIRTVYQNKACCPITFVCNKEHKTDLDEREAADVGARIVHLDAAQAQKIIKAADNTIEELQAASYIDKEAIKIRRQLEKLVKV